MGQNGHSKKMANFKIGKMDDCTISETIGKIQFPNVLIHKWSSFINDRPLSGFSIEGFWNQRRCTLSSGKWHQLNAWQTALRRFC